MRIGILYMCSGKYERYFDSFYESSKEFFLNGHEKHFFVFTDSPRIMKEYSGFPDITIHEQKTLGWPLHTLMRFWMFSMIQSELEKFDYLYFFNANFLFVDSVGEEILPDGKNTRLAAALHGWFYNKPRILFPYSRNPKSVAYIPFWKSGKYYQGSLNGGITKDYLELINVCRKQVEVDFQNNVVAKWYDESHLNKYLSERNDVLSLDVSYNYPEGSNLPFSPKILLRNKNKDGFEALKITKLTQ